MSFQLTAKNINRMILQTILYLTKQRINAGFEDIFFVLAKRFKRFSDDFRTI